MAVALVIPALDEETAIGPLLDSVDRSLVRDILVGDNGSRDATASVAAERGAEVIHVAERGYGAACAGALAHLRPDIDLVVFMDADGSSDPREIGSLVAPIANGRADFVVGTRRDVEPGAMTPQQVAGDRFATFLVARLYGHRYSDLGPFRAIRLDLLDRMAMKDRRYGWTVEMQIRAVQLGARILEVPVTCRRRRVGKSKISGTVAGVIKAGWWILVTIVRLRRR